MSPSPSLSLSILFPPLMAHNPYTHTPTSASRWTFSAARTDKGVDVDDAKSVPQPAAGEPSSGVQASSASDGLCVPPGASGILRCCCVAARGGSGLGVVMPSGESSKPLRASRPRIPVAPARGGGGPRWLSGVPVALASGWCWLERAVYCSGPCRPGSRWRSTGLAAPELSDRCEAPKVCDRCEAPEVVVVAASGDEAGVSVYMVEPRADGS